MLGNGNTAVLHTIDIGVLGVDASEGDVVDGFHADTHQPQQEGSEDCGQQDMHGCQIGISFMLAQQEMCPYRHSKSQERGIAYLFQVNKRGIAQDA